jgi:uncharacterized protein
MNEPSPPGVASRVDDGGGPWGLGATVAFGGLIVALWAAAQGIALVILAGEGVSQSEAIARGWIMARTTIVSAPIAVGAPVLLARARKGISVAAYLGLVWPPARQGLRWSLILLGFLAASDLLSVAFGRSVVPEVMVPVFQTAGSLPLFLTALVIAAPLAEEFLFRGFLFAGLRESRLGPSGAIALTALTWGTLHFQYDLYGMATVVVSGVLLGLIRWRTGSLWLCVLLHGLMNAVATIEMMLIL